MLIPRPRNITNKYVKNILNLRQHLYLDVYLVNYCNWNCKWCSRWCNVVKHRQIYKTEDIIRDSLRVLDTDSNIHFFGFNGGEPLLHPDIDELLKFLVDCKKKYKLDRIHIQTNGKKLLSMSDEFFRLAREGNLKVSYTKYPKASKVDYDEVVKRLKDEHIDYYNFAGNTIGLEQDSYVKYFDVTKYRLNDHSKDNQLQCYYVCLKISLALWHGKLFKCCDLPFIETLNDTFDAGFKLVEGDDYFEVNKLDKDFDLMKWKNTPSNFCKVYCPNRELYSEEWSIGKNTKDELIDN